MKTLIFSGFLLVFPQYSAAQEWIQNIKNPRMPFTLQYSSQNIRASDAKNYSDELEMEKASAKAVLPISKSLDNKQSLSFDFNETKIEQINESPSTPIPDKLTEMKFGHQFILKENEREYYGMNTQIGSSSDEPFFDWSVTEVSVTPFYYYDKTPYSSWVFMLNYSNQRSFLPHVPLPGFIYMYNNQEGFSLFAGVPVVGFFYSVTDKLLINYSSLIPWMHQFKVTYFIFGPVQLYSEFKMAPEIFKLVDSVDNEDRVILEDKRVTLGTKFPILPGLSLDIHGGYSYDREIYQAKRPGSGTDWLEEIDDQKFFNIQLGARF